jgi:myo-inositol-1(or 4)-monophosphatase
MIDAAVAAAQAAGKIIRAHGARDPFAVTRKGAVDLVTELDLAAESAIRESLARATPGIEVLAEEGGGAWQASTRWIVDPLDGTTNFVHGLPIFATSIGLVVGGRPVLGVVRAPALGWTFHGAVGHGALWNGQPIRVSTVAELSRALLVTGFPYRPSELHDNLAEFAAFMRASQGVRRLGSAALDLCCVACGWLDGFWERHIKSWDLVAGAAIVEAAGGRVNDPDGGPFVPETGCILASNGRLHQAMLDELARLR